MLVSAVIAGAVMVAAATLFVEPQDRTVWYVVGVPAAMALAAVRELIWPPGGRRQHD